MAWPGMPDFSDVVQNPSVCFEDNDLIQGEIAVNLRGLPLVYSGNFACVYKVSNGSREFAVRCFTPRGEGPAATLQPVGPVPERSTA